MTADPVMQLISREMMLDAAQKLEEKNNEIARLRPLAERHEKLMQTLQGYATVSCSGLAIMIDFSSHDPKDVVMDLLCGE